MASYVDFKLIKESVSLLQAMQMLGLQMHLKGHQYRSACPACQRGDDRSLVITPDKGFYCHAAEKGGDVIAFVAHVRGVGQREAAEELAAHFRIGKPTNSPAPPPQKAAAGDALKALDYLQADHPAIELLGLTAEVCEAIGIGFAPKGTMNGRLLVPLRLPNGTLVGYFGLALKAEQSPLLKFPDNLAEKVGVGGTVEEVPEVKSQDELRRLLRVV